MARRVYFAFDYANDLRRANQVRKTNGIDAMAAGGFDSVEKWDHARRNGTDAVYDLVDAALEQAEVTVVLIGEQTARDPYLQYQLEATLGRGKGLLGIYIHTLKGASGFTSEQGENPLEDLCFENDEPIGASFPTYDWEGDEGEKNLATWIETAYLQAQYAAEEAREQAAEG